jgi:hypothetical protein
VVVCELAVTAWACVEPAVTMRELVVQLCELSVRVKMLWEWCEGIVSVTCVL